MAIQTQTSKNFNNNKIESDDQINIESIFDLIKRNGKLLIGTTFLFIFATGFYILLKEKTWAGEFQIVMRSQKRAQSNISTLDPALSKLVGGSIWESAYVGSLAAAAQVSRMGNVPLKIEDLKRYAEV